MYTGSVFNSRWLAAGNIKLLNVLQRSEARLTGICQYQTHTMQITLSVDASDTFKKVFQIYKSVTYLLTLEYNIQGGPN